MIYLVIYLVISVIFAGALGHEFGTAQAILAGFIWPLTLGWFTLLYFLAQK